MFLDHGRYIVLPEAMRQLYCQLWCSFIANDTHTAREVATGIAGEPASLLVLHMATLLAGNAGLLKFGHGGRGAPVWDVIHIHAVSNDLYACSGSAAALTVVKTPLLCACARQAQSAQPPVACM